MSYGKIAQVLLVLVLVGSSFTSMTAEEVYKPQLEVQEGPEYLFVYFTYTACIPCELPEVKQAVKKAKLMIAEHAREKGYNFSATGVAFDFEIEKGIEALDSVGPFDEIVVGRTWLNLASLLYMSRSKDIPYGIPLIVIVEREITQGKPRWSSNDRSIVGYAIGTGIPLWVEAGAQLLREPIDLRDNAHTTSSVE